MILVPVQWFIKSHSDTLLQTTMPDLNRFHQYCNFSTRDEFSTSISTTLTV